MTGTVFVDRNGDGIRQVGERGVPGAVVAVDRSEFVTTDALGRYWLEPSAGEIIWVRVPVGFRPGPVWAAVPPISPDDEPPLDLALVPVDDRTSVQPLTFIVAADSHTTANPTDPWDGGDLLDAIAQATSMPEPPRFFTIVGDITQGGTPAELDRVAEAIAAVGVPWVPVPGNHDWLDGGTAYRARFGPDDYSFDVSDDLHVIVWDTNLSDDEQVAFFADDLARVAPGTTVVGLGHAPPSDEVADRLDALGVDYLFTGHWHASRRVEHGRLVEWGTQTFVMGGIDQSPAGYRVVTFEPSGPTIVARERLVVPYLGVVAPHGGSCAHEDLAIRAAAAFDAATPTVTARVDCGPEVPLVAEGGWAFAATTSGLTPGSHTLEFHATSPAGRELLVDRAFDVCAPPSLPAFDGTSAWSQLGGGSSHLGSVPAPIAPPLQVAWTASAGGSLALGNPVVVGNTIVVVLTDRGTGDRGGLVALELATGAERWRVVTPSPITAAPAVEGDTVIATLGDGEIVAVGLADGAPRWHYALGAGLSSHVTAEWAPPTIANGVVFAGVQGRFVALGIATGDERWRIDRDVAGAAWLGSLAAPAVSGDTVVVAFGRDDGATAFAASTGAPRWQVANAATTAINASPVIVDDVAYVAGASGDVSAIALATGATRWRIRLTPAGFDWAYAITAAPAYAEGRLFVPTQWDALVALDAAAGAELWRVSTPGGPLETAHYRSAEPGFAASPLVTGELVWIGRPDGTLVALAAADGHVVWSTDLGAPILSAPAPASGALIVATYDGTVRALVPGASLHDTLPPACPPIPATTVLEEVGGCCRSSHSGASSTFALLVVLVVSRRRRSAFLEQGPITP